MMQITLVKCQYSSSRSRKQQKPDFEDRFWGLELWGRDEVQLFTLAFKGQRIGAKGV